VRVRILHRILTKRDDQGGISLKDVRSQLIKEYMHSSSRQFKKSGDFSTQTYQEFWKYQTCFPDIVENEKKGVNAMPYLGHLILALINITVANVGVERSFKCQKFILKAERNRLSPQVSMKRCVFGSTTAAIMDAKFNERFANVMKQTNFSKHSIDEMEKFTFIDKKEVERGENKKRKKSQNYQSERKDVLPENVPLIIPPNKSKKFKVDFEFREKTTDPQDTSRT
jgi:hypothetical protein